MAYKEDMTLSERIYAVAEAVKSGAGDEGTILEALEALEEAAGVTYDDIPYIAPTNPQYPFVLTEVEDEGEGDDETTPTPELESTDTDEGSTEEPENTDKDSNEEPEDTE